MAEPSPKIKAPSVIPSAAKVSQKLQPPAAGLSNSTRIALAPHSSLGTEATPPKPVPATPTEAIGMAADRGKLPAGTISHLDPTVKSNVAFIRGCILRGIGDPHEGKAVVALLQVYARGDNEISTLDPQHGYANLNAIFTALANAGPINTGIIDPQPQAPVDILWFHLKEPWQSEYRRLYKLTAIGQGRAPVETTDYVKEWAKQEVIGRLGILKGAALGAAGLADDALFVVNGPGQSSSMAAEFISESFDELGQLLFGQDWSQGEALLLGLSAREIGEVGGSLVFTLATFKFKALQLAQKLLAVPGMARGLEGSLRQLQKLHEEDRTAADMASDPRVWQELINIAGVVLGQLLSKTASGKRIGTKLVHFLLDATPIAPIAGKIVEAALSDKSPEEKERAIGLALAELLKLVASIAGGRLKGRPISLGKGTPPAATKQGAAVEDNVGLPSKRLPQVSEAEVKPPRTTPRKVASDPGKAVLDWLAKQQRRDPAPPESQLQAPSATAEATERRPDSNLGAPVKPRDAIEFFDDPDFGKKAIFFRGSAPIPVGQPSKFSLAPTAGPEPKAPTSAEGPTPSETVPSPKPGPEKLTTGQALPGKEAVEAPHVGSPKRPDLKEGPRSETVPTPIKPTELKEALEAAAVMAPALASPAAAVPAADKIHPGVPPGTPDAAVIDAITTKKPGPGSVPQALLERPSLPAPQLSREPEAPIDLVLSGGGSSRHTSPSAKESRTLVQGEEVTSETPKTVTAPSRKAELSPGSAGLPGDSPRIGMGAGSPGALKKAESTPVIAFESVSQKHLEDILDAPGSGYRRYAHPSSGNPISEPGFRKGEPIEMGRKRARYAGNLQGATFPDVVATDEAAGKLVAMELKTPKKGETVESFFSRRDVMDNIVREEGGRLLHLPTGIRSDLVVDIRGTGQDVNAALNDLSKVLRDYGRGGGDHRRLWDGVRFITGTFDRPMLVGPFSIP